MVVVLEEDIAQLKLLRDQMIDFSNWKEYIKEPNRQVLYHVDPDTGLLTQYYESFVEANYLDLIAVIGTPELFSEWLPLVPIAELRASHSALRKVFY